MCRWCWSSWLRRWPGAAERHHVVHIGLVVPHTQRNELEQKDKVISLFIGVRVPLFFVHLNTSCTALLLARPLHCSMARVHDDGITHRYTGVKWNICHQRMCLFARAPPPMLRPGRKLAHVQTGGVYST